MMLSTSGDKEAELPCQVPWRGSPSLQWNGSCSGTFTSMTPWGFFVIWAQVWPWHVLEEEADTGLCL